MNGSADISVVLSPEEQARAARADALAASGEGGVQELVQMLDDPSWTVRRSVVANLAALGDVAVSRLCQTLIDRRDNEARIAAAVDALVSSRGETTVRAVVEQLAPHPDPAIVADAAQILGRRRQPEAIPTLVSFTEHRDDNVAVSAIEALGRIGTRSAVDALIACTGSGNFFRTFPAIDVLGRSGDPRAIPALVPLLGNRQYQLESIRALGRTGEAAAIAPLVEVLVTAAESIARVVASSLADLVHRHGERYGSTRNVEAVIQSSNRRDAVVRMLTRALTGADGAEQRAICLLLGLLGGEPAVTALAAMLERGAEAAPVAADALRRLGRESEAQLLHALESGDGARRKALLPVISRRHAADAVIACLSDPDPDIRVLACDALARIGSSKAVEPLFALLADKDPRVSQAAVGAIQALGGPETERLASAAARADAPVVRRSALRVLSYFGFRTALDVFLNALRDPDPRVAEAAIHGLAFLEDRRALEALFEKAQDPSQRVRAVAMRALGHASGDLRIEAFLLRGLKDKDAWVRYYACQSLGRLGVEAAADAVAKLLQDEAGQVRVAAVEALSHFRSGIALEALMTGANSDEEDVRRAALIGLGMARREQCLPVILGAIDAPDVATRLVALSALAEFEVAQVIPALSRAATDPDESVRSAAVSFLGGRPGPDATRRLIDLLRIPQLRPQVLEALSLPVDGRIEALLSSLDAAGEDLAPELTAALARMRRADATAALLQAFEGPNAIARRAAASALSSVRSRDAIQALQRHASEDPDPEVRRVCSLVLAQ